MTNQQTNSFDVTFTPPTGDRKIVIEYKESGSNWTDATIETRILASNAASPETISVDPLTSDVNADPNANAGKTYDVRVKTVDSSDGDDSKYSTTQATTGND